jgi:hypothetical protein
LPNDNHSIENALIIQTNVNLVPLLIDPQLSGTKCIRAILGETLVPFLFDQSDFLPRLKSCVTFRIPVIIENVGLTLDPLIDSILSKEFSTIGGQRQIQLGGELITYAENFRLYLSTKYPNPQYSPEICSQVSLINFTTPPEGPTDLLKNN